MADSVRETYTCDYQELVGYYTVGLNLLINLVKNHVMILIEKEGRSICKFR